MELSDITLERLESGELAEELPELYELKDVVENNEHHSNENVFDHTMSVLGKLEELLEKAGEKIKSHLGQGVGTHTRRELLFLATVFHDIAKKETIVKAGETTSCAGHEDAGSEKTSAILERLGLPSDEMSVVVRLVKEHGKMSLIVDPDNEMMESEFEAFKMEFSDVFLELVLMIMADIMGSQLKDNCPKKFDFMMKFYYNIIDNY